jgi:hypothetical protein
MAHIAHKEPASIGVGRRPVRPLAIAVAAALAVAAVVIVLLLAGGGEDAGAPAVPGAHGATPNSADGIRYDNWPDEGTRAVQPARIVPEPGVRYDGGPEEGTPDVGGQR